MTMWSEIAIGGGFVGVSTLAFRWMHGRINRMEDDRKMALYRPDGQPNYITRVECKESQRVLGAKIDEIKPLLIDMDRKREESKDIYHNGASEIKERLARIEAKLKAMQG